MLFRKFGILSITTFISILIAGVYGILHDQVTFSISTEYFTKFKYRQFGFAPEYFGGQRQTVAIIGFMATWWFGMLTGLVTGSTALIFPTHQQMKSEIRKAIGIIFLITILFSIGGYFFGRFYLADKGVSWYLPEDLVNRKQFIITGSVHNFSYLGGLCGLFIAEINMIKRRIYNY